MRISRWHAWGARLFGAAMALALVAMTVAILPGTARADTDLAVGGTGVVAYANGDSVRLRTAPGYDAGTVDFIPEGTSVSVENGVFWADDGSAWYQVTVSGETGYMDATYRASSGSLYTKTSGDAVTNDSVNMRSGPSTADGVIVEVPAGASITLTGDNIDGWLSAGYNGNYGYIYGAFIGDGSSAPSPAPAATTDSSSSDSAPAASGSDISWDGATGTRYTNDALNLRSGAGSDQGVITVLTSGTAVSLTGGVSGNWVQVKVDGAGTGWVSADYLTDTAPAAAASDNASSQVPAPPSDSEGQQIVNYAMQFLGYPYVWAGNSPDTGFDCSGFTEYVLINTIGVDIGHSSYDQPNYGTPVDMSNLEPGDLVFFANTDGPGVTHVGFYIGGGQFIHAENPSTGVVISDLNSDYYSSHYYGATRVR